MGKYQNKMQQYNETTTLRQFRGDRSSHRGYIEYTKHSNLSFIDRPQYCIMKTMLCQVQSCIYRVGNHSEQGAFHSAQNSGNVCQESNITDHFGTVRPEYLGPGLWRWFMHFDRNVPHHLTTIVAPCTSPLYPVYEYNNQTRGGLGRVCSTGMYLSVGNFRNFNTNFLLNVKPPKSLHSTSIPHPGANTSVESLFACQWLVCSSYFIKCFMFLASRIIVPP